jgi:hypothetical protein
MLVIIMCMGSSKIKDGRSKRSCRTRFASLKKGLTQLRFGNIRQLGKRAGIMDSKVREHFAIYLHIRLLEAMNQLTIVQVIQACSSVNTGNPKPPEITLAIAPIAEGIEERLEHRFICATEETMLGAQLALGKS